MSKVKCAICGIEADGKEVFTVRDRWDGFGDIPPYAIVHVKCDDAEQKALLHTSSPIYDPVLPHTIRKTKRIELIIKDHKQIAAIYLELSDDETADIINVVGVDHNSKELYRFPVAVLDLENAFNYLTSNDSSICPHCGLPHIPGNYSGSYCNCPG